MLAIFQQKKKFIFLDEIKNSMNFGIIIGLLLNIIQEYKRCIYTN